jgi:hypothetical protein
MGFSLSLSPEQARTVGVWALLLLITLDLLASADEVPFNSPRDWVLWLTQWRSRGLWKEQNRQTLARAGRRRAAFLPLNYLPLTGAWVPFMCAVLLGHFFHPGLGPLVGPGGFLGLGISLGMALAISVATYFARLGVGPRVVFWLVPAGLVCGVVVWPA